MLQFNSQEPALEAKAVDPSELTVTIQLSRPTRSKVHIVVGWFGIGFLNNSRNLDNPRVRFDERAVHCKSRGRR